MLDHSDNTGISSHLCKLSEYSWEKYLSETQDLRNGGTYLQVLKKKAKKDWCEMKTHCFSRDIF